MADERISSFITPEALAELDRAEDSLKAVEAAISAANAAGRRAEGLMSQARALDEIANAQRDIANSAQQMNAANIQAQQLARATQEAERARIQTERELLRLQQQQQTVQNQINRNNVGAADSLATMNRQLNELRTSYQRLSAAERENAQVGGVMMNSIRDLDAQLRAADASMGVFRRNVGNYSSATAGLRGSITQIARELPSLSGGFAVFASAIGNNLAPAAEAMTRFRQEQALLRAEGQPTTNIFKALGSAIFNWQTALIVGVTLMTVYGKEIGEFAKSLFTGRQQLDAMKVSQEAYNKALEDPAIKNATAEFEQMEQNIRLAKDGLLDKKQVLNIYNETIGKTLGHARNLNEAEDKMVKNKDAYIEMLKAKTIATSLYAQAAAKLAQAALIEAKIRSGDIDFINQLKDAFSGTIAELGLKPLPVKTGEQVGEKAARSQADDLKKGGDILFDAADEWEKKMADIAKKIGADPFGGQGVDVPKKVKQVTDRFKKLREEIDKFSKSLLPDATKKEGEKPFSSLFGEEPDEEQKKANDLLSLLKRTLLIRKNEKDKELEDDKKRAELRAAAEKTAQDAIQLGGELDRLQQTLAQRKIDDIDREIAKIEEKKKADIDAINASLLSQDEKAKKIAEINATADANEKKLEREKIERQRKAAVLNKAITVSQIIAQTALAIVKALAEVPWPYDIAQAAIVGAIGAAQVATVLATPLPQYEEGTKGKAHKGGKAIMFEGNKAEAVFEPGKAPWIGTREGVYDLAPGSHVMSNKELMNLANMYTLGMPALIPVNGSGMMDSAGIKQGLKDVQRAIENKPESGIYLTWKGLVDQSQINGNTIQRLHNLRH